MDLRYGMNPHQHARVICANPPARAINGAPSMINWLDALNAWQLVRELHSATGSPAATSFKHVSPAGAAIAGTVDATMRQAWGLGDGAVGALASAYVRARDADPKSSFGDMIAVSEPVDDELADILAWVVADGIIAAGFAPGTIATLSRKKSGRFLVLEADPGYEPPQWEQREVFGVRLEQQRDALPLTADLLTVVMGPTLSPTQIDDALLGMVTARYTQSNTVVFTKDGMALGIAAGQQSRVDCTKLAARKLAVWWRRRHPAIRGLAVPADMSRQERLNWQIRVAENDMTPTQRRELSSLIGTCDTGFDNDARSAWDSTLTGVTLISDGYIPFRDNIDVAGSCGVSCVVEPGGSMRSGEVQRACAKAGITLVHTNTRLFHH